MKFWFRRNQELVIEHWNDANTTRDWLVQMAFTAGPEKAAGWFRKCGYPVY